MNERPKPRPLPAKPPTPADALRILYCLDCGWVSWEHDMRWLSNLWHAHADDTGHAAYRWEP